MKIKQTNNNNERWKWAVNKSLQICTENESAVSGYQTWPLKNSIHGYKYLSDTSLRTWEGRPPLSWAELK